MESDLVDGLKEPVWYPFWTKLAKLVVVHSKGSKVVKVVERVIVDIIQIVGWYVDFFQLFQTQEYIMLDHNDNRC